jgi:hypothetical protein
MTCRLIKKLMPNKAESSPMQKAVLDVRRLIDSGAIIVMPVNCWFSRTLRLFRREGRVFQ